MLYLGVLVLNFYLPFSIYSFLRHKGQEQAFSMASNNLSRFSTSLSATLGRDSSSNNTGQQSASDPDDKSQDVEAAMAEVIEDEDPDARPKVFRNAFEECIFVFTVMLSTASTTFLQGVIVINTATIGASLHMVPIQIVWISAAIGYGSQPPAGCCS